MKDFIKKDDGHYYECKYSKYFSREPYGGYRESESQFSRNAFYNINSNDHFRKHYDCERITSVMPATVYTASNKVLVSNIDDSGLLHRSYSHYNCKYKDGFHLNLNNGNIGLREDYREYYDCEKLQATYLWHEEIVPTWNKYQLPILLTAVLVPIIVFATGLSQVYDTSGGSSYAESSSLQGILEATAQHYSGNVYYTIGDALGVALAEDAIGGDIGNFFNIDSD